MAAPCQLHAVVRQQQKYIRRRPLVVFLAEWRYHVGTMRLRDQIRLHQEAIRALALTHGARDVRVFGSVARGDEGPESDVDFLVALDKGRTLFDLARLEIELERLLRASVDVSTEAGLREPVRTVALREAIRV